MKKQLQEAINVQLENTLNCIDSDSGMIDYKEMVKRVAEMKGITCYEVLTHLKTMEKDGFVRFFPFAQGTDKGIGMVSETYRLKLETQMVSDEVDYVDTFMNEALILSLCS